MWNFKDEDKIKLVSVMIIHNFYLLLFFITSLLFAIIHNPIKRVYKNIQCNLTMTLRTHEVNDSHISPSMVLSRYRINLDESGFEAIISLHLQWANYLNLIYFISKMIQDVDSRALTEELLKFEDLVWSVISSVLALTLAQNKVGKAFLTT